MTKAQKTTGKDSSNHAARKGRPRSEKSRQAILKATAGLLLHKSIRDLSIEAVAKKAKVGKTTIYRWWPNKTALVMDVLMSQPGLDTPLPTPKNNAEALTYQLEKLIRLLHSKSGEMIAQLLSESQMGMDAQNIFEDGFLTPLMDAMAFSIEEGQKAGELRNDIDVKAAIDTLCGPLFFRLLAHPHDLNEKFRKTYPKQAVALITA